MLEKLTDIMSEPLKTRPLAVFSILTFIFAIGRLYYLIKPLLFVFFVIGILLVILRKTGKVDTFILIFMLLAPVFGFLSASFNINRNYELFKIFDNENVRVEGEIVSVPESGERGGSFYIEADKIYSPKGSCEKQVKVYVQTAEKIDLKFGDRVVLDGFMYKSNGKNVHFSKYYLSKGTPFILSANRILDGKAGTFPKSMIPSMRNYILTIGDSFFEGDVAALFKALTAGDKSDFSDDLYNDLKVSGLSHIACVSGLHVSILGMAVYNLLRKRNRNLSAVLSVVMVCLFTTITGASPSTIRAAIMFISFIIALLATRENDSFTALCLSAMVLVTLNPYVIFDWGFILSFLSVLGIQIFSFSFKRFFRFLPDFLGDSMSVTISAQLMTIPATANMFGYLSVYSVIANILVSFIFLATLYFCFITIFVSFIPGISSLIAFLCSVLLYAVVSVANFISAFPISTVPIDSFDVAELVIYYTLVVMFVFRKKLSFMGASIVILICSVILLISSIPKAETVQELEIGSESYLFSKDGETILLAKEKLRYLTYDLKEWGNTQLDVVIVNENTINDIEGLIDIKNLTDFCCVHIPEEYKNSDFDIIARRLNLDVVYYKNSEDEEEIYKYSQDILD